jgi:hypothetical protein
MHATPEASWFGWQAPPRQVSGLSQLVSLESPHAKPLAAAASWTQPLPVSHESTVHASLSSHDGGGPPTQMPTAHTSPVVQTLPSSQESVLLV